MSGTTWTKFFWSDWESDEGLRQCSLAAQGLWMRMLCICAKGEPRGYLTIRGVPLDVDGVSTAVGRPETEVAPLMAELEHWGVYSRDRKARIYSRRIVRDEKRSQEGRKAKLAGLRQGVEQQEEKSGPSRGATRGPSPHKPEARNHTKEPNGSSETRARQAEFDAWWEIYPHKVGKGQAERAFKGARRSVELETLIAGVRRYIATKPLDRQWCNPATWLNGKRWLDQEAPVQPRDGPRHWNDHGTSSGMSPTLERLIFDEQRGQDCHSDAGAPLLAAGPGADGAH